MRPGVYANQRRTPGAAWFAPWSRAEGPQVGVGCGRDADGVSRGKAPDFACLAHERKGS